MSRIKSRSVLILCLIALLLGAAYVALRLLAQPRLNNPESIVYDESGKRFLISNTGNGKILSLDNAGKYGVFLKQGLDKPRGLALLPCRLYVADNDKVRAIDLKTAQITATIPIPGAKLLNDIAADHTGLLYITDTAANKLFILDPATKKVSSAASPLLQAPNGIVYDYPRRQMFIVCFQPGSPVLAYNLDQQNFSVFRTTLYDNLDGITIDDLGRIYFSSWGEKSIIEIPQEQNRTLIWQSGIPSPADIYYNRLTNEILVPLFEKNEIRRFPVD